jgi:hypothetical protein
VCAVMVFVSNEIHRVKLFFNFSRIKERYFLGGEGVGRERVRDGEGVTHTRLSLKMRGNSTCYARLGPFLSAPVSIRSGVVCGRLSDRCRRTPS